MSGLLEIKTLSAGYSRGCRALKGVDFRVQSGEFVGIAGPNGSGKSTLIRVASRSLRPSEGSVLLNGKDIWDLGAREFARKVAVVPQETFVPFDISALEIVMLGRHPHVGRLHLENADDHAKAMKALEAVGAAHLAHRSVREISGGERQRVIIAKAMVQEPELLFLDEPTSHLDVSHQTEVLSLVSALASERNMAVVAALHDLNLASAWCRRICILQDGAVFRDGSPEEVITEETLAKVWHARMWVKRHPATGKPFLLPMPPPYETDEKATDSGLSVHVICGGGSGGPALSALMEMGCRVTCGVVNIGDSDEEMCRAMNIPHIAEAPYSPISEEREQANRQMALAADAVVLTDFCVGPGNISNLRIALDAVENGKKLLRIVDDRGNSTDYTGGEGRILLEKIQMRSSAVDSVTKLTEMLGEDR